MKTLTENAQITFRQQLSSLKAITGYNNEQIANMLGCSSRTVARMYEQPFTVSGQYILMIQEYLKKEERQRYI